LNRLDPAPEALSAAGGSEKWGLPRATRLLSGPERAADAAVLVLGAAAAVVGSLFLATISPPGTVAILALGLYALGLLASFGFSAVYNLAPPGPSKAWLRRCDHAAIFLLIAGTYSPVALLAIGGISGVVLFAFVWTGAILGAAIKLCAPHRFDRAAIAAYLLLGWVGVFALFPLIQTLSPWQLGLLGLGGVLYSAGVPVHLSRLPYHSAIWHASVLAAAICHYLAIVLIAGH
jgi:hemolysin III